MREYQPNWRRRQELGQGDLPPYRRWRKDITRISPVVRKVLIEFGDQYVEGRRYHLGSYEYCNAYTYKYGPEQWEVDTLTESQAAFLFENHVFVHLWTLNVGSRRRPVSFLGVNTVSKPDVGPGTYHRLRPAVRFNFARVVELEPELRLLRALIADAIENQRLGRISRAGLFRKWKMETG